MYTPRPLPTMDPDFNPYGDMFDMIPDFFNRITDTLASVPVIPNPNGLFDPTSHEWYTPALSALDVLMVVIFLTSMFGLLIRLAGSSGTGILSGSLSGGNSLANKK